MPETASPYKLESKNIFNIFGITFQVFQKTLPPEKAKTRSKVFKMSLNMPIMTPSISYIHCAALLKQ
jgi:hypothetical protein